MRWADALGNVDGVGSVVPHEAWHRHAFFKWRRWPVLAVFAACTGLATIAATKGIVTPPVMMLLGVTSYLVGAWLPRPWSVSALAIAAGALGVALLYASFATTGVSVAVEAVVALPLACCPEGPSVPHVARQPAAGRRAARGNRGIRAREPSF